MNGVEILSENVVYITNYSGWIIPVFTIIGLVVGIVLCILDSREWGFEPIWIFAIGAFTIACLLFGLLLTIITATESDTIDHIEYKVTIDDTVSMNEFLDKYEILDQEGKIYTIRERESHE